MNPFEQGSLFAAQQQGTVVRFDQAGSAFEVPGVGGIVDHVIDQTVLLEPLARQAIEPGDILYGLFAQKIGKERMIAKPGSRRIERYQEQVGAFDVGQKAGGPSLLCPKFEIREMGQGAHQVFAQRNTEAVEQSADFEKFLHGGAFMAQDFTGQVVENMRLPGRHNPIGRLAGQGQAGQLQTDCPTLGGLSQAGKLVGAQVGAHNLFQKSADFGAVETQIGGVDFNNLVEGAQAGQVEAGHAAADQRQVQTGRAVFEQKLDQGGDCGAIGSMIIVKDDGKIVGNFAQVVEQGQQDRFVANRLVAVQQGQGGLANLRLHLLKSLDKVREKAFGRLVSRFERQPCDRHFPAARPFGRQGGLAKTGGSRHQGQRAQQPGVHLLN